MTLSPRLMGSKAKLPVSAPSQMLNPLSISAIPSTSSSNPTLPERNENLAEIEILQSMIQRLNNELINLRQTSEANKFRFPNYQPRPNYRQNQPFTHPLENTQQVDLSWNYDEQSSQEELIQPFTSYSENVNTFNFVLSDVDQQEKLPETKLDLILNAEEDQSPPTPVQSKILRQPRPNYRQNQPFTPLLENTQQDDLSWNYDKQSSQEELIQPFTSYSENGNNINTFNFVLCDVDKQEKLPETKLDLILNTLEDQSPSTPVQSKILRQDANEYALQSKGKLPLKTSTPLKTFTPPNLNPWPAVSRVQNSPAPKVRPYRPPHFSTEIDPIPPPKDIIFERKQWPQPNEPIRPTFNPMQAPRPRYIPPFLLTLEVAGKHLHNCFFVSSAATSVMPEAVARQLNLRIIPSNKIVTRLDTTRVQVVGDIRNLKIRIASEPRIEQCIDIVVVKIPEVYGMFLGRDWSKSLDGYFAFDLSHLWLPWKGQSNQICVESEPFMKELITEPGQANEALCLNDTQMECCYFRVDEICDNEIWSLFFDGARSKVGSGAGIVLIKSDQTMIPVAYKLEFSCTNNMAEYEALVLGLQLAISHGVKNLKVMGDSELVVRQVRDQYACKSTHLKNYRNKIWNLIEDFDSLNIIHIPREINRFADELATSAAKFSPEETKVSKYPIEIVYRPSVPNNE